MWRLPKRPKWLRRLPRTEAELVCMLLEAAVIEKASAQAETKKQRQALLTQVCVDSKHRSAETKQIELKQQQIDPKKAEAAAREMLKTLEVGSKETDSAVRPPQAKEQGVDVELVLQQHEDVGAVSLAEKTSSHLQSLAQACPESQQRSDRDQAGQARALRCGGCQRGQSGFVGCRGRRPSWCACCWRLQ